MSDTPLGGEDPPDYDSDRDGPITGSWYIPAMAGDVKKLDKKVNKEFKLNEVKTVVGIVVASVATAFGVFFALESRGQARVDGGLAPVVERVARNETKTEHLERAVQESALRTARIEVMMELMLKDQRIKPPPPVVLPMPVSALDGGHR